MFCAFFAGNGGGVTPEEAGEAFAANGGTVPATGAGNFPDNVEEKVDFGSAVFGGSVTMFGWLRS